MFSLRNGTKKGVLLFIIDSTSLTKLTDLISEENRGNYLFFYSKEELFLL
ncbi:hypothetical protein [Aquimarina hainanensis]